MKKIFTRPLLILTSTFVLSLTAQPAHAVRFKTVAECREYIAEYGLEAETHSGKTEFGCDVGPLYPRKPWIYNTISQDFYACIGYNGLTGTRYEPTKLRTETLENSVITVSGPNRSGGTGCSSVAYAAKVIIQYTPAGSAWVISTTIKTDPIMLAYDPVLVEAYGIPSYWGWTNVRYTDVFVDGGVDEHNYFYTTQENAIGWNP